MATYKEKITGKVGIMVVWVWGIKLPIDKLENCEYDSKYEAKKSKNKS